MEPISAILGIVGSLAGTFLQYEGAKKQAAAAFKSAYSEYLISQEQIKAADIQKESNNALSDSQIKLQDIQRQQAQLQIRTQRGVIEQQSLQDDIRRQQNLLVREENIYKKGATVQQEGLAELNDAFQRQIFQIARQQDVQDREQERLQGRVATLTATRQQRDIIRQGIAARASASAQEVNKGIQQGSTLRTSKAATLTGRENLGIQQSAQDLQIKQALLGSQATKRELGVNAREIGTQQFELQSQSRQVNFGVAMKQFETADKTAALNDKMFDINKFISNLYLSAQDVNAGLVNQGYDEQANLTNLNRKFSDQMLDIQKNVYGLGGQIALQKGISAKAGEQIALGQGIMSLSQVFGKNVGQIGSIGSQMGKGFGDAFSLASPSFDFGF